MEIVQFILSNAPTFLFVMIRTGAILLAAPVFGTVMVPMQVKMGLTVLIALIITPLAPVAALPQTLTGLVLGLAGEMMIGVTIGYAIRFVFTGIEFAGQIASFQMGIGMASAYDPLNSAQSTVVGRLMSIVTLLTFLSVNGHLMIIMALKRCFVTIPPFGFTLTGELVENFVIFSKEIFVLALTFAAPIIAILVFVNVALGIMAKTVPQINMFAVGFSITILAGFVMLALSMPMIDGVLIGVFDRMWDGISAMIRVM